MKHGMLDGEYYDLPGGICVGLQGRFRPFVILAYNSHGVKVGEVYCGDNEPRIVRFGSSWFSRENALAYMEKHFGYQEHEGWNDHE